MELVTHVQILDKALLSFLMCTVPCCQNDNPSELKFLKNQFKGGKKYLSKLINIDICCFVKKN